MIMVCINMDKLNEYVEDHKSEIYSIYAGIEEAWYDTSDEIYFYEQGWLEHDASLSCVSDRTPVAIIHYKADIDETDLISEFKIYKRCEI